ncbi:hypothetical protein RHMOL_Rhmol03G0104800 [Rhododendron molle]|uniref:Uncharacterized protein n=1 Tax=Rhododendron molle TaxID=49168 RepID=A0ACC0PDX3_RHOML|nr:hypothetical protein RHMOL_Rhmol03G0104800 [Rhododendron molle]
MKKKKKWSSVIAPWDHAKQRTGLPRRTNEGGSQKLFCSFDLRCFHSGPTGYNWLAQVMKTISKQVLYIGMSIVEN